MGTGRPHVEITSATLAGGENNQDRFAYGNDWAFVLDGASSFAKTQPEHDGGWFAERLKHALAADLTENSDQSTPVIVEAAIRAVAKAHGGDVASCPTSTIALARWDAGSVEVYLLGDSTVALISADGEEVFSDARLADIACPLREEYRSRLRAGHGFDDQHRALLQELQEQQAASRNRPGGYWIAGAEPEAAHRALIQTRPLTRLRSVVLATDGAAAGIRYGVFPSWDGMKTQNPDRAMRLVHDVEESDLHALLWPRSKPHDDKTTVAIDFLRGPGDLDSDPIRS